MTRAVSYLRFVQAPLPASRRTGEWDVRSARTNDTLGVVLWRGQWRQYVFEPMSHTVWSAGCMAEVETFIRDRMAERKAVA